MAVAGTGRSCRRRRRRRTEGDTEGTNYACRIAFDFDLVIEIETEMTLLTSSCYGY